ncbi:MAG: PhzF family phenazine biosynthesis protein [Rubrivivax sp.]|jgi:PhzF family phenazine biosynthesis protein
MRRRFHQVDVFTAVPLKGNPLAVVHDAAGLDDDAMAAFARWTNLSETTFLLPPDDPLADYRVRIFTPGGELPFAGHPTLGSCWAWLAAGGTPRSAREVVQQCGIGRVRVRRDGARLAFAAPALRRSGPLEPEVLARITQALNLSTSDVVDHQWVDNGPGWCAVMLRDAATVKALRPDMAALGPLKLGVVAPQPPGAPTQFEVRAFVPSLSVPEDPVTGSLNAGLALWLIATGQAPSSYLATQGTVLGRDGRVHVQQEGADVWIGGDVVACVAGEVTLPGPAGAGSR